MDLNKNLKFARQRKGLTQKQVAEAIHVDKTTYAHYESGRRTPNAKTWVALCQVLEIPVFPAQVKIVYPEGLLDDFEKYISDNEQPTEEFHENNNRFRAIYSFLTRIYEIHKDAMDITDLPIDQIDMSLGSPVTVMNVSLDIRAEKLIEKATKCMEALMSKNQDLFSNK